MLLNFPTKHRLNRFNAILIVIILIFIFSACKDDQNINPQKHILAFDADVNFEFRRFDKEWFDLVNKDTSAQIDFYKKYKSFLDPIARPVFGIQAKDSSQLVDVLVNIAKNPQFRPLYDTTQQIIGDLYNVEASFQSALNYYHHYFPTAKIPTVTTLLSEFGVGAFTIEAEQIGIGLDMFLGEGFPAYAAIGQPVYLQKRMDKEDIVTVAIEALVNEKMPAFKGNTMMDEMIYNGQKMYFLEQLLPTTPDSILWGFTKNQFDWCTNHEKDIWTFFADEELLYSTNNRAYQKYIGPSPDSPGMPEAAPGKTGNFIGYQIVHAYMKQQKKTALKDLIQIEDYQKILQLSRYKPKR